MNKKPFISKELQAFEEFCVRARKMSKKEKEENKELSTKSRNLVRVNKIVEAERLIKSYEYNKNRHWWNMKNFDYDVFVAGFSAGIKYIKRVEKGNFFEEEIK
jgi:hypothetical protein